MTLLHFLPSYESMTRHALANRPISSLLRGVLGHFDLLDVYRALALRAGA